MNKVTYIKAYFKPVGKLKSVKVPTGEKKKGLLWGEKEILRKENQFEQTGWSESEIDGERLALDIERAVNNLNDQGHKVIIISEVISGDYNYHYRTSYKAKGGFGYGYGFSYTEGVTIISEKI